MVCVQGVGRFFLQSVESLYIWRYGVKSLHRREERENGLFSNLIHTVAKPTGVIEVEMSSLAILPGAYLTKQPNNDIQGTRTFSFPFINIYIFIVFLRLFSKIFKIG